MSLTCRPGGNLALATYTTLREFQKILNNFDIYKDITPLRSDSRFDKNSQLIKIEKHIIYYLYVTEAIKTKTGIEEFSKQADREPRSPDFVSMSTNADLRASMALLQLFDLFERIEIEIPELGAQLHDCIASAKENINDIDWLDLRAIPDPEDNPKYAFVEHMDDEETVTLTEEDVNKKRKFNV